jgi:hypothetical protein
MKRFNQGDKIKILVGEEYVYGEFHRYGETRNCAIALFNGDMRFVDELALESDEPTITQEIPRQQLDIVIGALKARKMHLMSIDLDSRTNEQEREIFDIYGLIGLLSHKTTVELTQGEKQSFCHNHNVDFPEFVVPVEPKLYSQSEVDDMLDLQACITTAQLLKK